MKNNPWRDMKPGDYDAHMSHPNVMQTQMLSQIMKEQLELIPWDIRFGAAVGILGIANGNGLEHIVPCGVGKAAGIDINQSFLDECKTRFPALKGRLYLYQMDLMLEAGRAIEILSECRLIIANLLIEHIHLNHFAKIIRGLPKSGIMISCVIQSNPDGTVASKSGCEQAFDGVVKHAEEENAAALSSVMRETGYAASAEKIYGLPNGKQFIRLDYTAV